MKLLHGGTIDHGRFTIRRSCSGQEVWLVSTKAGLSTYGTIIGEVDTLDEVEDRKSVV